MYSFRSISIFLTILKCRYEYYKKKKKTFLFFISNLKIKHVAFNKITYSYNTELFVQIVKSFTQQIFTDENPITWFEVVINSVKLSTANFVFSGVFYKQHDTLLWFLLFVLWSTHQTDNGVLFTSISHIYSLSMSLIFWKAFLVHQTEIVFPEFTIKIIQNKQSLRYGKKKMFQWQDMLSFDYKVG